MHTHIINIGRDTVRSNGDSQDTSCPRWNLYVKGRVAYNFLTKCKSFADTFIIQTCGNNRQLDYATP